jgi:hypothetical protein
VTGRTVWLALLRTGFRQPLLGYESADKRWPAVPLDGDLPQIEAAVLRVFDAPKDAALFLPA